MAGANCKNKPDILFEWDICNDTLNFSSNWRKKFGYEAIGNKISGRIPLSDNIHLDDMPVFVKIMKDTAVGVILDINAEKKEKQNLLKLAQHDPLTGIYNKTATNAMVARRMKDFDFTVLQALLIIDIDFFKTVNDTYVHKYSILVMCN